MNKTERYKEIGRRIRVAREEANLSQQELATKINRDTATAIYLMENGDRKVSIVDLEKIAQVLDRDLSYFLGESEATNTTPNLRIALRSDPNLEVEDKQAIMRFVELAEKRNKKKNV